MQAMTQSQRGQAFALAKTLGYQGDAAAGFLRDIIGVKSLVGVSVTQWNIINQRLRNKVDELTKPHLVSAAQWGVVCQLRRKLRLDDSHFNHLVTHITQLENPKFLDVASCRALIAGLNKILAAQGKPENSNRSVSHEAG